MSLRGPVTVAPPIVVFTHNVGLSAHLGLLLALAGRDIRARYRQSFLGIYWAVLNPLLQTLVLVTVFVRLLRVGNGEIPFVVLYFSGIAWWNFFTTAVTGAMGSVVSQMYLLEKNRIPAEVLPLSAVVARTLDLAISGVVLVGLAYVYGTGVAGTAWLVIPMAAVAMMATVGTSLLVAGLNVLYRDVSQLVQLAFTLGFFLTPVVYDVAQVPERFRMWVLLNPIATAIHGARAGMFMGTVPPLAELLPGTLVAAVLLMAGIAAFQRLQATFTEIL
jgi:lipopolysaccharide transport system permease protein